MAAIRVLHIIDRLDKRLGGSVSATLGVCKYLALAGVEVEAAGSVGPNDELDHLEREYFGFKTHLFARSFPARYANSAAFSQWLPGVLKEYDLVEIHAIFSAFTLNAAHICRQMGKPYVVRPHGSLDPFDLKKHALLKKIVGPFLIRPLLESSSAVLLTALLEAERLETYGARVRKVVLPLPVPLSAEIGNRDQFRRRHGIPANARVVLFMSRIDYKKGLDFLIPAIGRLRREIPELWFVLAGAGDAAFVAKVRRWLVDHGVSPITSEVGFLSGTEKLDSLAAADIFALPSLNENFGIVNVEAMHSGLPLLVSSEVYIHSEIAEAKAGIICYPNIDSVVAKLRLMLGGKIDLKLMGQCGQKLVQARYRPDSATSELISFYEQALGISRGQ